MHTLSMRSLARSKRLKEKSSIKFEIEMNLTSLFHSLVSVGGGGSEMNGVQAHLHTEDVLLSQWEGC